MVDFLAQIIRQGQKAKYQSPVDTKPTMTKEDYEQERAEEAAELDRALSSKNMRFILTGKKRGGIVYHELIHWKCGMGWFWNSALVYLWSSQSM
jgi:hypothetical protein